MILDDLVVELPEDGLVVVDEADELSGDVTQILLTNAQTRRNLKHMYTDTWEVHS